MAKTSGSTVIQAPIARVWSIMRDFTSTPKWFPACTSCTIEGGGPAAEIGAIKLVGIPGSDTVREQLVALSDAAHTITYRILAGTRTGGSQSAFGALASVELREITDSGQTFVHWSHEFDLVEGKLDELRDFYLSLYPIFFAGLRASVMQT